MFEYPPCRCACTSRKKCQACKEHDEPEPEAYHRSPQLTDCAQYTCPHCGELFIPTKGQAGCIKKGQLVFCLVICGRRHNDKLRRMRYRQSLAGVL